MEDFGCKKNLKANKALVYIYIFSMKTYKTVIKFPYSVDQL